MKNICICIQNRVVYTPIRACLHDHWFPPRGTCEAMESHKLPIWGPNSSRSLLMEAAPLGLKDSTSASAP
jgi:hypothetical protein